MFKKTKISLELVSSDNRIVMIKLKVPIRDMLSGIIEVYGSVDEKGNIHCVNYTTFESSATANFDKRDYPNVP